MSNGPPRNIRKSTVIKFCRREINLIYEDARLTKLSWNEINVKRTGPPHKLTLYCNYAYKHNLFLAHSVKCKSFKFF